MNVFISQPMNGKTENEINDVRVEIISKLEKKLGISYEDIYVVNDFDYGTEMPSRLVMLGRSIETMAEADVIVFAEGFSAASGCLVEHEVVMSYINTDEFKDKRVYFERRGNLAKARSRTDVYKGYEYEVHKTDSIPKLEAEEDLKAELEGFRLGYDILVEDYDRLKNIYESNVTAYTKIFEERNKYRDELYDLGKEYDKLREKVEIYKRVAGSVYGLCQPRDLCKGLVDFPYTRYDKMVIQADNGLYVSDIKYKDGELECDGFYTTDCKLSSVSYCIDIKDAKVYTDWPEAVCDRRQLNRMGSRYKRTWFSIKEFTF